MAVHNSSPFQDNTDSNDVVMVNEDEEMEEDEEEQESDADLIIPRELEWYREQFELINAEDISEEGVQMMRYIAMSSKLFELADKSIIPSFNLDPLFRCLRSEHPLKFCFALEALKNILSTFGDENVYKYQRHNLKNILTTENIHPLAKQYALEMIKKLTRDELYLSSILDEPDMLSVLIRCLQDETISVGGRASELLRRFLHTKVGMNHFMREPHLKTLERIVAESPAMVRHRVYQFAVEMFIQSPETYDATIGRHFMPKLLEEATDDKNDVLTQLSAMAMLYDLSDTEHGFQYLLKNGIFDYIERSLEKYETAVLFKTQGVIKLFGHLATTRISETMAISSRILDTLFTMALTPEEPPPPLAPPKNAPFRRVEAKPVEIREIGDIAEILKRREEEKVKEEKKQALWPLKNVILETFGYIASDEKGKAALSKYDDKIGLLMKKLMERITGEIAEDKVVALNVLSSMLVTEKTISDDSSLIAKEWYDSLAEEATPYEATKTFLSLCEQPFPDLKLACLKVFSSLAKQPWGQKELLGCPGMVEYLLDRDEKSPLLCLNAKFDIVNTLVSFPFAVSQFPPDIMQRLELHARQGVSHVEVQPQVTCDQPN